MIGDNSSSTHPPLPPTTEDDRFNRLRLLRSRRVGPATYRRLLSEHGSASAALDALPDIARAAGVPDYSVCPEAVIAAEMKAARSAKATLLFAGERDYPSALAEIDDAPPVLWTIGVRAALHRPLIALVGARNGSSLGTRMAEKLGRELSEAGMTIVSGLARGIDAAAHRASLDAGTVAVMAGGADVIYPAENTDLARAIPKSGLRLSDQPMGQTAQARHFVARNRIISGMSLATVVIEAAAKSGSLITARIALDQGRDVLAVPGHPFDARVSGCNMLIRDGAVLVRGTQDILDHLESVLPTAAPELPLDAPEQPTRALRDTPVLHEEILARLSPTPIAEDQLIRQLQAAADAVAPALMDLEIDGRIVRQAGGLLARVD
ncbi:MAG: DNA-processing protein DprA [Pseudomonadota bacterium]